ncbi:MAG: hypothetical protein K6G54_01895 [Oscillospiraceae bacterium]|nr:hypothetical protein [Oscillospiraceae bacterium]
MFRTRNNGTRGYTGYRGRSGGAGKWLILLLVLLILAGAAFLIIQRYRVYRADGSSYIEMPWARSANETQTAAADTAAPQTETSEGTDAVQEGGA